MTETEIALLPLIRERCYQKGDFTLSSGAKSGYYFDGKMVEMFSAGASLIGEIIFERTKDMDIAAIGGLEIGAVPLTTAAVCAYNRHGRVIEGFFVRQEAKTHGTKKIIEGRLPHGSKVVIVDDVVTTGTSILKAIAAVRRAECDPLLVLALVDRLQGAAELFQQEIIPYQAIFSIHDFESPP
jgi:orotate phosphoribosyltransferase